MPNGLGSDGKRSSGRSASSPERWDDVERAAKTGTDADLRAVLEAIISDLGLLGDPQVDAADPSRFNLSRVRDLVRRKLSPLKVLALLVLWTGAFGQARVLAPSDDAVKRLADALKKLPNVARSPRGSGQRRDPARDTLSSQRNGRSRWHYDLGE